MTELLRTLCELNGTSGRESEVRDFIINRIKDLDTCEYTTDPLGNLLVSVKGKTKAKNKVMVCAHMDEVGVIATYITNDGYIKFTTVGGIQSSALIGKAVKFENGTVGVIGIKPVHLCSADEKTSLPKAEELYIDIASSSRAETEALISPGDTAVFMSEYTVMGDKILSKAIDDRAGCAIMLDMIEKGVKYDMHFAFTVQEEVGLRGAKTATFNTAPDYAVIIEATTAADIADVKECNTVCKLNGGAVVSFMDRATVYDFELYKTVRHIADVNGIPSQTKTTVAGGNDAGSVHVSRDGVRTTAISIPCRYIHSPSCVCSINDVNTVRELAQKTSEYFASVE